MFKLSSHADRLKVSQESEEALRRCISLDPTDARAYVTLGKLLQQQHRLREARQNYEDAVAVTGLLLRHKLRLIDLPDMIPSVQFLRVVETLPCNGLLSLLASHRNWRADWAV